MVESAFVDHHLRIHSVAEALLQYASRASARRNGPGAIDLGKFFWTDDYGLILEYLMPEKLADKKCVPCRGDVPPLKGKELAQLSKSVPLWKIENEHHVHREFRFPDFKQALDFVNRVGALAEEQGHHPDILLAWGKAEITLWTHKIDGLTESDLIMAAKIDRLTAE